MAGLVGAATWYVGHLCGGGVGGALVMVALLVVLAGWMFHRSRVEPINSTNVNEVWNGTSAVVEPSEPVAA
jgi:PiT family inorganic phosphate transporter